MSKVRLEHNLTEYELVEVLEKSLSVAEEELAKPERFEDPFMQHLAKRWQEIVHQQLDRMLERIEEVFDE